MALCVILTGLVVFGGSASPGITPLPLELPLRARAALAGLPARTARGPRPRHCCSPCYRSRARCGASGLSHAPRRTRRCCCCRPSWRSSPSPWWLWGRSSPSAVASRCDCCGSPTTIRSPTCSPASAAGGVAPDAGAGAPLRHPRGPAVPRPRRLQGRQRCARSSRGRPRARLARAPPARSAAPQRHRGPHRRGRVRGAAAPHRQRAGPGARCTAARGDPVRSGRPRVEAADDQRRHRHSTLPRARRHRGGAARPRRPGDVPGEADGRQPLPGLRCRTRAGAGRSRRASAASWGCAQHSRRAASCSTASRYSTCGATACGTTSCCSGWQERRASSCRRELSSGKRSVRGCCRQSSAGWSRARSACSPRTAKARTPTPSASTCRRGHSRTRSCRP